MLANSTIISHFIEFYFTGVGHEPWYHAAVWGNVIAVIPLAILGFIGYWIHKFFSNEHKKYDARHALENHDRKLRAILDALDPDTEGGIQEIHDHVEKIQDQVDESTPGGLGTLYTEVKKLSVASPQRRAHKQDEPRT